MLLNVGKCRKMLKNVEFCQMEVAEKAGFLFDDVKVSGNLGSIFLKLVLGCIFDSGLGMSAGCVFFKLV
jgi:hypothetical protein